MTVRSLIRHIVSIHKQPYPLPQRVAPALPDPASTTPSPSSRAATRSPARRRLLPPPCFLSSKASLCLRLKDSPIQPLDYPVSFPPTTPRAPLPGVSSRRYAPLSSNAPVPLASRSSRSAVALLDSLLRSYLMDSCASSQILFRFPTVPGTPSLYGQPTQKSQSSPSLTYPSPSMVMQGQSCPPLHL